MTQICIWLIRLYQWAIAPVKRLVSGGRGSCRYVPSCSHYAIEALQVHGLCKGLVLATIRILRCHPWGGFGLDRVPPRLPWKHVLGLRLSDAFWHSHADHSRGAVLVCRNRLVTEAATPAAAIDDALQGSRRFDGGILYTHADCSEHTLHTLQQHAVSVTRTGNEATPD